MKEKNNIAEISVRYTPAIANKPVIKSSLDAYFLLKEFFDENTIGLQEEFVVMFLNKSNRVLGIYPLAKGAMTSCLVDVRLVLSVALTTASTAILLCHNHPSGNLKPSRQDEELTMKIKEAAKYLDIAVFDHLIINSEQGQFFSFASEGLI